MPQPANLDLDTLRTFVRGVDLGSFARAAAIGGRSPSAVSSQLRRLEAQVGEPLVMRLGRGLRPTPAGEALLGYARRLLALNDEALSTLGASRLDGMVRLGLPPDFAETWLPDVLGRFSVTHPKIGIEVQADRSAALVDRVEQGALDLALAWGEPDRHARAERVASVPVGWIVRGDAPPLRTDPVPLVAFDEPCLFRRSGVAALERSGRAWRLAFTSPSLPGLWAAVGAGLGVTMRTAVGLPASLRLVEEVDGLPPLPPATLALHRANGGSSAVAAALADLVVTAVQDGGAALPTARVS